MLKGIFRRAPYPQSPPLIPSASLSLIPGLFTPAPTAGVNYPYFAYDNLYYPDLNPPGHTAYLDNYGLVFEGPGSSQVHIYSLASREYTLALYDPSSGTQHFTQSESLTLATSVPEPSSCVMAAVGVVSAGLATLWKRRVERRHVALTAGGAVTIFETLVTTARART